MKKVITFFLAISMLLCVQSPSFAAEEAVRFKLDAALKDASGWSNSQGTLVFENDGLTDTVIDENKDVFGYQNKKFKNEIIEFDAVFNFVDASHWQGIMIRAKSAENLPWKDNETYLIVITEKQIELQRFSYRSGYLAVVSTPFKSGERVNVQFGAINTDNGVELVLKINGQTIINVVDTDEAAIRNEGHFAVYNASTLKLLPSSRANKTEAPCVYTPAIKTEGIVGDKVYASYKFVSYDNESEAESEFTWYRAFADISVYGKSALLPDDFENRYLEKIVTTTEPVYTLTEEDVGKYIVCGIRAKAKPSGSFSNEMLSNAVQIDILKNTLGQGIFFANDSEYAINKGKRELIDSIGTAPFSIDGTMYLPLRYVSEALGYKVEWNAEKNVAVCTLNDKKITIENNLNGSVNKNNKLYIPENSIYELFGIKSDYKPLFGMGIVSNQNIGLDEFEYRFFLKELLEKITEE